LTTFIGDTYYALLDWDVGCHHTQIMDDNAGATIGVHAYVTNHYYFKPGRRRIVVVDGMQGDIMLFDT